MAQTKTRYLNGTVDKTEQSIEFVIEELSDREFVARALDVEASKVRNVGQSSNAAYKRVPNASRHGVERQAL